ncbi:cytochrome C [Myxococcaceae bacterium GXIMD 01537]
MTYGRKLLTGLFALVTGVGGVALATDPEPRPRHVLPASKDGNLVLGLCDGDTALEVKGVKEGGKLSRPQALDVTRALMTEWRRKNPDAKWDDAPAPVMVAQAPAVKGSGGKPPVKSQAKLPAPDAMVTGGESAASGAAQVKAREAENLQTGHTYGAFSARDEQIWAASTQAFVDEGKRVFHDADALGSTVAVSCDMCHPDAANTHPETYPKYQVQFGRAALLRDMINWCIENPVRGKPLADDDPRMKAMEAYIYAQRKGVPLEYGKH